MLMSKLFEIKPTIYICHHIISFAKEYIVWQPEIGMTNVHLRFQQKHSSAWKKIAERHNTTLTIYKKNHILLKGNTFNIMNHTVMKWNIFNIRYQNFSTFTINYTFFSSACHLKIWIKNDRKCFMQEDWFKEYLRTFYTQTMLKQKLIQVTCIIECLLVFGTVKCNLN